MPDIMPTILRVAKYMKVVGIVHNGEWKVPNYVVRMAPELIESVQNTVIDRRTMNGPGRHQLMGSMN